MSNNPFAGWTLADAEEHNRRVALGRMRGNPTSDLFEKAQRDKANGIRISNFSDPISAAIRAGLANESTQYAPEKNSIPGAVEVSKNGRRKVTIGGKEYSFRSHWEVNYAYYLQFLKTRGDIVDWEYEPQVFYFDGIRRGTTNYTPDFKVTYPGGKHDWREVKGFMSPKDKTKLKRMKKFFPEETIKVIGKDWFKLNGPRLSAIVPGWSRKKK
jgi:hypothetical protein